MNRDDSNEKLHDCGLEKERIEPASAFDTRVQLGIHLANERRTNSECERSLVLFSRYITPKRIERSVRVRLDSLMWRYVKNNLYAIKLQCATRKLRIRYSFVR